MFKSENNIKIFNDVPLVHLSIRKRKKGFTLAEILIAMGVLGIIATVLLPVVIQSSPNQSKVMFRKAYSSLQNAVNAMINDDNNYPSTQTITLSNISYPLGFNYTTVTSNASTNKFCYFLTDSMNTIGTVSCPLISETNTASFTTADGIYCRVYMPITDVETTTLYGNSTTYGNYVTLANSVQFPVNATQYTTKVMFDVNGTTKGPNCTADTGGANVAPYSISTICSSSNSTDYCSGNPDNFIVGVRYDGKVQVGITGDSDNCANYILLNPTDNSK